MVVVHQPVWRNIITIAHIHEIFHILRKTEKAGVHHKNARPLKFYRSRLSLFFLDARFCCAGCFWGAADFTVFKPLFCVAISIFTAEISAFVYRVPQVAKVCTDDIKWEQWGLLKHNSRWELFIIYCWERKCCIITGQICLLIIMIMDRMKVNFRQIIKQRIDFLANGGSFSF